MPDRGIQLANAVVAKLASLGYTAARQWNPLADFKDLGNLVFWVVPKDENSEKTGTSGTLGACSRQWDFTVYLVALYRPANPASATAVDSAAADTYDARDGLEQAFLTLADGTVAKWQKTLCSGHDFKQANGGLFRKEIEMHWRVYA